MRILPTDNDLYWGFEGDIRLSNKDLRKAEGWNQRVLIQEIENLLKSSFGDWDLHPRRGANLREFIAAQMNDQVLELIANRIINTLSEVISPNKIKVVVKEFNERQCIINLMITVSRNETLVIDYTFDMRDNILINRK